MATTGAEGRSHWRTPMEMFGSLLAGIAFAIGHDQFYRRLHGTFVDGGDGLDWNRSPIPQEWVIRIATAFAFLVKTFLVIAVCIAYSQRMWYNLNRDEFRIQQIDSLTSVLVDIFSFRRLSLWGRVPLLALMGAVAWALSIVAVVTPGTLVVVPSLTSNTTALQVPRLSFSTNGWVSTLPTNGNLAYEEPSAAVKRVTFASATSDGILPIPHKFVNMSYVLEFPAPAIQCARANDTIVKAVRSTLSKNAGSGGSVHFLAWAGDSPLVVPVLRPNSTWIPSEPPSGTLDMGSGSADAARLFFMSAEGTSASDQNVWRNVTECLLYNATYTTRFSFSGSATQRVEMENITLDSRLSALNRPEDTLRGSTPAERQHMAYQAVMDAFGQLFVGAEFGKGPQFAQTYGTSFRLTRVRWIEPEETQRDLEDLFRNVTLSMLTSGGLVLNETQAVPVPVTVISFPSTYWYSPRDLLLTYSVAVGVALVATLIGVHAIWLNGRESYSSKFSTFVRATRRKGLDYIVDDADYGANPLPKRVGETKLVLGWNESAARQMIWSHDEMRRRRREEDS